ncbi:ABC transporter substrate-binding protein [Polaromonas sp.]|uniref:ABC transporter substrate-binding protein n=1 Tax=Polaromonas sp. TaxID=1869339 RepID=UPI002731977B|nr:ABC transporter substrate-binding protein [Polaromonas sp.]MDP1740222.1 ABC transporter substrate-binding protein [Polaromonas sp.]
MKTIQTLGQTLIVAALLLAGAQGHSQDGVSKTTIVLGQSLALTGPGSALAQPFHEGAKLYFDRLNASGGVNGRKIDLVTLDDQGNPANTAANAKKLLDQGVLSLFGFYGSPQVTAAYPLIKDGDVLLFAPMSAADEFRGGMYTNIYSLRPGYSEEAAAITKHAATLGTRKLAILHASDGESLAALDSAERTMTSMGANLLVKSAINSGSVANSVDKAMAAKPESILVISDFSVAANVVRELRAKGFRGPIYGFSNTGESLLAEQLGPAGAGVVVVRVVPKSDGSRVAVVRELQADAATAKLGKPNVYMLEGYIAARVYAEALRRIPKDPTRAKLKKAIEGLDEVSVGGFRVHFTEDRVASKLVELSLIDSQGRVRE